MLYSAIDTKSYFDVDKLIFEIFYEKNRAVELHGEFHSLHEAYAVLLEEVDEVWDIVKQKRKEIDKKKLRIELIQVAAMCVKLIESLDKLCE